MSGPQKHRIMVVDDTITNIKILVSILGNDYRVSVSMDGETALKEIAANPPDLILLDIMMPGMDGFEVCRRLKEAPALKHIPVIFLTALIQSEDVITGLKLGAVDYVTKPFNKNELLLRVKTHIRLYTAESGLQEAIKTRDRFFSILAHDLKNPFNTMLGFADILHNNFDKFDDDRKKKQISIIKDSGFKLYRLLENLLEWSLIERGMIDKSPESFLLHQLVAENIDLMQQLALNKGIKLSSDIHTDTVVFGEMNTIHTIVRNLISNALKFTEKGGEVKITSNQTGEYEEISVMDTGVGMAKELVDKLFKLDQYFTTEGTQQELGTGLGLLLVKEYVEKNNGIIKVSSEPGQGSCFTFSLPKASLGS